MAIRDITTFLIQSVMNATMLYFVYKIISYRELITQKSILHFSNFHNITFWHLLLTIWIHFIKKGNLGGKDMFQLAWKNKNSLSRVITSSFYDFQVVKL